MSLDMSPTPAFVFRKETKKEIALLFHNTDSLLADSIP